VAHEGGKFVSPTH